MQFQELQVFSIYFCVSLWHTILEYYLSINCILYLTLNASEVVEYGRIYQLIERSLSHISDIFSYNLSIFADTLDN